MSDVKQTLNFEADLSYISGNYFMGMGFKHETSHHGGLSLLLRGVSQ
jgi:hypothetical protein